MNSPGAGFCEACGAQLQHDKAGSTRREQDAKGVQQEKARGRTANQKHGRSVKRSWEPWQLVAGGILIAVVAFFVYTELNRQSPNPPSSEARLSPGTAAADQEIDRLEKVVQANPTDAASLLHLANLLHDNGLRDTRYVGRAIEMYKRYLALNPDNPDARVDMGICYFELARTDSIHSAQLYETAAREMEAAFASHPTHQTAAFNLGIVYLNAGKLDQSRTWLQKATQIDARSSLGIRAKELLEQHTFSVPH